MTEPDRLSVLTLSLDDVTPHPRNVREGDVGAIVESLRAFGQYRPIVVQRPTNGGPGYILAGSHTYRAHRALATEDPDRWGTIDAVYVDVDDATAIRIMLADNRTHDLGRDRDDDLAVLLAELAGPGMVGTGYTGDDLDVLLADLAARGDAPDAPVRVIGPSLFDRFVVPPFTVLDSRQGYWQDRKRRWLALGIRSELGRGEGLTYDDSDSVGDTDFYYLKSDAEGVLGREVTRADFVGLTPAQRRSVRELRDRAKTDPAGARRDAEALFRKGKAKRGLLGLDGSGAVAEAWDNRDPGTTKRGLTYAGNSRAMAEAWSHKDPGTSSRVVPPKRIEYTDPGSTRGPARAFGEDLMRGENPNYGNSRSDADRRSNVTGAPPMPGYADIGMVNAAPGTSIFDPVLAELAYRWWSPPGGTVLDPFAGGSVRGIVAAVLGRRYVGIDLSAAQVAANRDQARDIIGVVPGTISDPDALTPVERHGDVWMKREDLFDVNGATGGKARATLTLAEDAVGIISVAARTSPQNARAARIAAHLGIPARCHTGAGADTPETAAADEAGAEVIRHAPGRLTVLLARWRADVDAHPGWAGIPFGAKSPVAAGQAEHQAGNIPDEATRIVVPVGSGTTAAGILAGTSLPVLGVVCGMDPTDTLDEYAPGWRDRLTLVPSGYDFDAHPDVLTYDGVALDGTYEAKCLPHLQPGDVLWVTGGPQRPSSAPVWIVGDSADVLTDPDAPVPMADLLFSCPPYHDLEVYSDDPADLSNLTWDGFDAAYRVIIRAAAERLRPDRFAAFVVGDVRDAKGIYRDLPGLTVSAFRDAGLALYNEAAFINAAGSLPMRAGRQFAASRKLGRTHQQLLVFVKGDPVRATAACGPVVIDADLEDVETPPDDALPSAP